MSTWCNTWQAGGGGCYRNKVLERAAMKGMETFWGAEFLTKGKNKHMFTH